MIRSAILLLGSLLVAFSAYPQDFTVKGDKMKMPKAKTLKDTIYYYFNMTSNEIAYSDISIIKADYVCFLGENSFTFVYFTLSNRLPSILSGSHYLIIHRHSGTIWCFRWTNSFFLLDGNQKLAFVNGVYTNRSGHGYLYCYIFDERNLVFRLKTASKRLVVNRSDGCISYLNDALSIEQVDLDGDGLLDMRFTGDKLIFCNPDGGNEGPKSPKPKKMRAEFWGLVNYENKTIHWKSIE